MAAAWPSFALTASYELLTRQVRCSVVGEDALDHRPRHPQPVRPVAAVIGPAPGLRLAGRPQYGRNSGRARPVSCSGGRGSGPWPTGPRTGPCPAAKRLPVPTAGKSGGVGSSRTLAWPMPSVPKTHKYRASSLMRKERCKFCALIRISHLCGAASVNSARLPLTRACTADGQPIDQKGCSFPRSA